MSFDNQRLRTRAIALGAAANFSKTFSYFINFISLEVLLEIIFLFPDIFSSHVRLCFWLNGIGRLCIWMNQNEWNSMSKYTKWTKTLDWYNKISWFCLIAKWCALRNVWQTNLICDINRNCDYAFIFIDYFWNGNEQYYIVQGVRQEELKMSQPIAMLTWCHLVE